MKTYDETFERVMAERDSYMRRKKERTKAITTGSIALAGVALAVVSVIAVKNRQQINTAFAEDKKDSVAESVNDYTVPDLLTQEITSYFGVEDSTRISEENGDAIRSSVPEWNPGPDSLNETQTVTAPATADEKTRATTAHGETKPATATAAVKSSTTVVPETVVSMKYTYSINSGKYKNYCPGKVIEKDKVGEKIGPVTVTGYWEGFGAVSENKTEKETLSADVYYIKGVSDDVAVCLKFNDKGDALTTTHYYVVINPEADYSPVMEYVIGAGSAKADTDKNVPTASNPYYEEISKEQEKTRNKNEYVTAVTSKAHTPE